VLEDSLEGTRSNNDSPFPSSREPHSFAIMAGGSFLVDSFLVETLDDSGIGVQVKYTANSDSFVTVFENSAFPNFSFEGT
jgi:hypothetical protein